MKKEASSIEALWEGSTTTNTDDAAGEVLSRPLVAETPLDDEEAAACFPRDGGRPRPRPRPDIAPFCEG